MGKNEIKQKKKTKRMKISLFHVILLVIFIYVVVTMIKQELVLRELTKKNQIATEELKSLKIEVKDLGNKIDKSETVEYIEKIAREELNMIKPHEIIYRDKNKQDDSSISD